MVLADLGRRLTTAFRDLNGSAPIDEKASLQFDVTLKEICAALLESDVNVRLVQSLRKSIKHKVDFKNLPAGSNRKRYIAKAVFDELVGLVDTHEKPYEPKPKKTNVIMLVGLQGAGKTTTCTKLALYYQRRGFKSCLVCADTFRAGAFDQLKQNAIKARIPFFGSYTETDPAVIAAQGVERFRKEKYSVIIVDTSGRHRQEEELFKEMVEIGQAVKPDSTIMILDASIGQAAEAQSKAFKESSDFGSIIITKMDGHAKGGGAISAVAATHTPISFIGTGEHMYDLERFAPQPFISKLLGMGDMATLMDQVKTMNLDKNKDMVKHLEQGIFTIRDMRDQLNNIMKMGPLSKLAGNIPGMGAMFQNAGSDEEGSRRMRQMMYMMDSMTEKELDSDGKCFVTEPTRLTRIARGSGTSVRDLEELLSQHRVFAQMAKKMGGKGGMMQQMAKAGGPPKNAAQAAALQKKLQQQAAAGGGGGGQMAQAMKMLKDMMGGGGDGGMPDMATMQNMMSQMGMGGGMGGMGRGAGRR